MTDALTRAVVEAARLCVAAEDALHGDFAVADVLSVGATMRGLRAALHALDAAPAEPEAAGTAGHANGQVERADVVYRRGVAAGRAEVADRLAALEEVARALAEAVRIVIMWRDCTFNMPDSEGGLSKQRAWDDLRRTYAEFGALSRLRGEPDGTPVTSAMPGHRWARQDDPYQLCVVCGVCRADVGGYGQPCPALSRLRGEPPAGAAWARLNHEHGVCDEDACAWCAAARAAGEKPDGGV